MTGITNGDNRAQKWICMALSVIAVVVLSSTDFLNSLLNKVKDGLGTDSAVITVIFWILIFLLVHEIISVIAVTLLMRRSRPADMTAIVLSDDIRIRPKSGIGSIPSFRDEFREVLKSSPDSVIDGVNTILGIGFSLGASDIHIAPQTDRASVILRIHGNLYPLGDIPGRLYPLFARRIKILSDLLIYRHDVPQDGKLFLENRAYTVRVAVFPTSSGDRFALRLADVNSRIMDLGNIGMPRDTLLDYRALLNRSQGMIVITGPTGSGKSTTMFSSLLHIQGQRKDRVNIVTLEDPIETALEGFFQTQVGQNTGLTFSSGLRSVLRQDPDVIMLGEIRDEETAAIAIRAAMTGHLILTTVHASSTAGVFSRLSQMGTDPVQLSSSRHAVIAQRLCRRLCPSCRMRRDPSEEHLRELRLLGVDEIPEGPFFEADGCSECLGLGFTGRSALFEMLLVTNELRDSISSGRPAHELRKEARKAGMRTLLEHGLELVREGRISLMELTRVVSD